MFDQLISILAAVTIATGAYGLGRPVVRGLGVGREDRLSAAVWSITVGLIVAGTLLAGVGLIGGLYVPPIGVLSMAASFWGIGQLAGRRGDRGRTAVTPRQAAAWDQSDQPRWAPPPRWLAWGILSLAGLACLGSLVGALAPPTAGDALCYHLELPKTFLAEHRIQFLPDSDNSTFPMLVEMWYLWGLALDGPVTAGLIHWGAGILLALATVVLATPIIGRRWAWIAGAVVVLVPGISNQMTAPLNDVALALCATLAVAAWHRAVFYDESRRWFVLAGLAAGGALATKYVALILAAAVAIVSGWVSCRHRPRRRLVAEGGAIVLTVAVSVSGLWYVRAAWHRGNPVYPFLSEVFASGESPDEGHQTLPASKSPLGRSLLGLAAVPWQVTMRPERFGGRGHQLGVLFLAALPGVFLARRLRGLTVLLAVAAAYAGIWYLLRQNVRFLFPVVPLLTVGVVWVWIEMRRLPGLPRLAAGAAFALTLTAFAGVALLRCRDQLAVACALESRQEYLTEHEPTWPAADVSNQLFGRHAHLLSQDYRALYFQCRVTRESIYRRRTAYDRQISRPTDLSRQLRRRGFTHVLLAENLGEQGIQFDPTLSRLVDAQWAADGGQSLVKLTEYRFADSDGAVRRYRLLMLR